LRSLILWGMVALPVGKTTNVDRKASICVHTTYRPLLVCTCRNGPTRIIPGTQLANGIVPKKISDDWLHSCLCPILAGAAIVRDARVLHRGQIQKTKIRICVFVKQLIFHVFAHKNPTKFVLLLVC